MKLKEELALRQIGEDYMIIDPGQDMVDLTYVFTLNETAKLIWTTFQHVEFTPQDIVDVLMDNFEVSRERAFEDAQQWIKVALEHNILID